MEQFGTHIGVLASAARRHVEGMIRSFGET